MRIERDVVIELIKQAGYNTEKNSAMVDVFDRFAQLVVEKVKPAPKQTITIEMEKAKK